MKIKKAIGSMGKKNKIKLLLYISLCFLLSACSFEKENTGFHEEQLSEIRMLIAKIRSTDAHVIDIADFNKKMFQLYLRNDENFDQFASFLNEYIGVSDDPLNISKIYDQEFDSQYTNGKFYFLIRGTTVCRLYCDRNQAVLLETREGYMQLVEEMKSTIPKY